MSTDALNRGLSTTEGDLIVPDLRAVLQEFLEKSINSSAERINKAKDAPKPKAKQKETKSRNKIQPKGRGSAGKAMFGTPLKAPSAPVDLDPRAGRPIVPKVLPAGPPPPQKGPRKPNVTIENQPNYVPAAPSVPPAAFGILEEDHWDQPHLPTFV